MTGRIPMQTAMRRASVEFLNLIAADGGIRLQVYPGRPRSINPPTGFVDLIRESIEYDGLNRRTPQVDIVLIWGLFDSLEAVTQKDAFVDAFINTVFDLYHQANANTMIGSVETVDVPDYVPDWLPPAEQRTYYATRITLEGLALTG